MERKKRKEKKEMDSRNWSSNFRGGEGEEKRKRVTTII